MTQPAKSNEPTMEEILASIRRIIADDDIPKSTPLHSDPLAPQRPRMAAPTAMPVPEPEPIFEDGPQAHANESVATGFDPMFEELARAQAESTRVLELTQDMRA